MAHNVLGVIGGSGFYQMKGLDKVQQLSLQTPFGEPSDPFYQGRIGDLEVVFLARHGRGHRLLPSEINFRSYIFTKVTSSSIRSNLALAILILCFYYTRGDCKCKLIIVR